MELCSGGRKHEQICYEGGDCPVCELLAEIEDLKKEIEEKDEEIEKLNKMEA